MGGKITYFNSIKCHDVEIAPPEDRTVSITKVKIVLIWKRKKISLRT